MDRTPSSTKYQGNSAYGHSRQHMGNVHGNMYNYDTHHHYPEQRSSDDTRTAKERHADYIRTNEAFFKAAASGQIRQLQRLLPDVDVDFTDENGLTAIHHAAINGLEDIIHILIEAHCDLNPVSEQFGTPLCAAVLNDFPDIVEVLVSARANINTPCGTLGSALHTACREDNLPVARILLASGARKELKDHQGETPLHTAAHKQSLKCLKLLAEAGANLEAPKNCMTPLQSAASNGQYHVARVLVQAGANVNDSSEYGFSGYPPVRLLMADLYLPYAQAKMTDVTRLNFLRLLLQAGADTEFPEEPPLIAAVERCEDNKSDVVKLLLDSGARTEAKHAITGLTALHIAVKNKKMNMAKLLLDAGAIGTRISSNVWNGGGTAFEMALHNKDVEMARLFLHTRADTTATAEGLSLGDNTPLNSAVVQDNVEMVRLLLQTGANPNAPGWQGMAALHTAAQQRRIECAELLLAYHADVKRQADDGSVPLDYCISRTVGEPEKVVPLTKMLLRAGARLNTRGLENVNLLFGSDVEEVARLIIQAGAV